MSNTYDWRNSIAAIGELERQNAPLTPEARVAELLQACRDAQALEGLSQCQTSERLPWPESTQAVVSVSIGMHEVLDEKFGRASPTHLSNTDCLVTTNQSRGNATVSPPT